MERLCLGIGIFVSALFNNLHLSALLAVLFRIDLFDFTEFLFDGDSFKIA